MDETIGQAIKLVLKPHAVSLGLSVLFYMALPQHGLPVYGIPIALAYFILVNLAVKSNPISIDIGQGLSDSFLSSFANNLVNLAPEQAFSEAMKNVPSPQLCRALAKVRDGIPLSQALLNLEMGSPSDKTLLTAISNALSYGSTEASDRLR